MSFRSLLVVMLALATGGLSVVGVTQFQGVTPAAGGSAVELTKVVVVAQTIPRGEIIKTEDVALKEWPKEFAPEGMLTSLDEAIGRLCLQPLVPGEPVLSAKLAASGSNRSAGNLVRPGMRAFSIIAATLATSVAGLVLPGDRVDVILTVQSNANDESGGGTSTTLLQNIEILALDQELEASVENRSDPSLKAVTLLVTQREAALLSLGQKTGLLSLSLRNPDDVAEAETEPVTLADVRFRQERVAKGPTTSALLAATVTGMWDRVSDSLTKAAEARAAAEAQAQPEPIAPPRPRVGTIRTLRGSQSGVVLVNYEE
jgi:pilus assembly protein CpaB